MKSTLLQRSRTVLSNLYKNGYSLDYCKSEAESILSDMNEDIIDTELFKPISGNLSATKVNSSQPVWTVVDVADNWPKNNIYQPEKGDMIWSQMYEYWSNKDDIRFFNPSDIKGIIKKKQ